MALGRAERGASGLSRPEVDVAVIGLGPTGAVLANLLGLLGLRVVVFERDRDLHDLPRAVHHDDEVMRIFQAAGVAGEVAAVSRINAGMRFVDQDGRLLLDWPRPQDVGPQGWYPSYRFHQPDLDRILRARLAAWPSMEVRLGHAVRRLEQDADGVTLEIEGGGRVRAGWAVGCDGARSLVRRVIGGATEDLGFHERWLVADVVMRAERPDLGDYTIQHCHPERAVTQVRGPGLRRRWEIALREETDAEALAPDYFWRRLARWIEPGEAEVERAAVYTFHSVIAGRWRAGRLLIAGDAAHQTPPFMGQGMCAGVRDAANLAWKLAAVARGADDALLDTYQSERHPHVREYIRGAVALGRLINATDPDAALKAAFRQPDGTYRMSSIKPRLGPGLSAGDGTHAGTLSGQPLLASGALLDDEVGYAPVLLAGPGLPDADGRRAAGERGIRVLATDEVPGAAETLAGLDAVAALIRPDRYLLGTARGAEGITALIGGMPGPLR